MSDLVISRLIERLCRTAPLSPEFYAARDELEHFGSTDSARYTRLLHKVSLESAVFAGHGEAQEQVHAWLAQLQAAQSPASAAPPKRSWLSRLTGTRPAPTPPDSEAALRALPELAAYRDRILRRVVEAERFLGEIDDCAAGLERACELGQLLHEAISELAANPAQGLRGDAIGREFIPVVARRRETLVQELALISRIRLELGGMREIDAVLVGAIDGAIKVARLAGSSAAASRAASQDIAAAERDLARLGAALQAGAGEANANPNLIDPGSAAPASSGAAGLQSALAGVEAAMHQLDSARSRLEGLAAGQR